mmetsp:Transcript_30536/g.46771  ORF Transcript_30536/g.46771 Transcript_30536/m.46771 type:complete len:135 (+) Transcript_30536:38-442(+)
MEIAEAKRRMYLTIFPTTTTTTLLSPYSSPVPLPNGDLLFVNANQQITQLSHSDGIDVTPQRLRQHVVDPLLDAHITYSSTNRLWAIFQLGNHSTLCARYSWRRRRRGVSIDIVEMERKDRTGGDAHLHYTQRR